MKPILELSFRNLEKTHAIRRLVEEKAAKLEEVRGFPSCRVAVERRQKHQRAGNPYRVRIELGRIRSKDLVVVRESSQGDMHDPLPKVIREAFNAARRQLKEFKKVKRGKVKQHPEQQLMAVVVRLFPDERYGFLKTPDERELYFHRNSVLQGDFDRLAVGTGVRFSEEMGEEGPQAATVRLGRRMGFSRPELSKIERGKI